jgi:hypothetical protein
MKNSILAAGLVSGLALIAAPAFAGSVHDLNVPKSESKAVTFTDTQMGGMRNSDSAIEQRNTNLRRAAQDRSPNARAAWQGSVHYY